MQNTELSAVLAPYVRKLTKEEINAAPLNWFEGKVTVVSGPEQEANAMAAIDSETVVGFDTETRPAFRRGQSYLPALLQLATATETFLFRLSSSGLPAGMAGLLADNTRVKAGVAVTDDIAGLKKLTDFEPGGFIDLGEESRRLQIPTNGLRNLAVNFLGFRISKGAQRSNWSREKLTPAQIRYASTDAWVSRQLYLEFRRLDILGRSLPVTPQNVQ